VNPTPQPELAKAMLAAQTAMPKLLLDAVNPHFNNKFVSLPGLLDTVRPVLNTAGLVLTQTPTYTSDGTHALRTRITHAGSGQYLEDTMLLCLSKPDAQAQGSAITYARRYAILSVLGLAGEEDDDGAAAVAPRQSRQPRVDPPRPTPEEPNPVVKAQEAQAAGGDVPTDAGDPRNVLLHFGKNKGKRLGDLSKRQLEWYANTWEPNPQFESPLDRQLKLAVQMILGLAQDEIPEFDPIDDDEIPF
jgi:uncharacterized protein (DUF3820 family)